MTEVLREKGGRTWENIPGRPQFQEIMRGVKTVEWEINERQCAWGVAYGAGNKEWGGGIGWNG